MAKPSLCKDFLRASWWTWHFMKHGYNLRLLPGEETITDNLLIYLVHRHQKQLRIYRLNKSEESEYGADWEWWFHTRRTKEADVWVGMRVQAKKLNPCTLRYESLGKGEQADNLIEQVHEPLDKFIRDIAEKKKFMAPIYVFYNYWCLEAACQEKTLQKHGEQTCSDNTVFDHADHPCKKHPPGCTMADARKVRELIRGKKPSHALNFWNLHQEMFCWADLVCCKGERNHMSGNGTVGIAEHVEEVLRSHGIETRHRDRGRNNDGYRSF